MRFVTVELADRSYEVTPLPIKRNREWRSQFDGILQDVVDFVAELGSYAGQEYEDAPDMINKLGQAVSGSLPGMANHLVAAPDLISEAVFQYSPEIAADREYIETNAYEDEMVAAFLKILSLAYPFGQAVQGLLQLGRMDQLTDPNSVSQS